MEKLSKPKRMIMFAIKIYRCTLSPLLGNQCRFYPSCSEYAMQAIQQKNLFIALKLICSRVFRCNPFCKGGYDPLKQEKE